MGVRVRNQSDYKYVRRAARGAKYQSRPHIGPHRDSIFNLGLYDSPIIAHRLALEFLSRLGKVGCPAAVLVAMQAEGKVRAGVLPTWVTRDKAGTYSASHELVGTLAGFTCPVLAFRTIFAAIRSARAARSAARIVALISGSTALAA